MSKGRHVHFLQAAAWNAEEGTVTILANLVGGLIFFWVDRWIFSRTSILAPGKEIWEIQNRAVSHDGGKPVPRTYRLIRKAGYRPRHDGDVEGRGVHDHAVAGLPHA
jgi:hypothetical protein